MGRLRFIVDVNRWHEKAAYQLTAVLCARTIMLL